LLQWVGCLGRTSCALERERLKVGITGIVFSIEGEFLESISPLVRFYFRVGHESIAHSRAQDLKHLFLFGDSTHIDDVVHVDEAFYGVGSFGSRLLVLVVLQETVALG
jgi:hypothetical protein